MNRQRNNLLRRLNRQFIPALVAVAAFLSLCADSAVADAPQWNASVETHAWTRFGPRVWKQTQVQTDWYDGAGKVKRTTTTETRTQVIDVGRRTYSLCVATEVEVAGRSMPPKPKTITRSIGPDVDSSDVVGHEPLTINGQEFQTDVIQFVVSQGDDKQTGTVYYAADAEPHVLKRVSVTKGIGSDAIKSETTVTVTDVGVVRDILGEMKPTWSVTTIVKHNDVLIVTREVKCDDVPGELVASVTEERDREGQLVRRSELELVGYGFGRLRRLFRRRRPPNP